MIVWRGLVDGVQASSEDDVPANQGGNGVHFMLQGGIADDVRCTAHAATQFVQPLDTAHDQTLLSVRASHDLRKRLQNSTTRKHI